MEAPDASGGSGSGLVPMGSVPASTGRWLLAAAAAGACVCVCVCVRVCLSKSARRTNSRRTVCVRGCVRACVHVCACDVDTAVAPTT